MSNTNYFFKNGILYHKVYVVAILIFPYDIETLVEGGILKWSWWFVLFLSVQLFGCQSHVFSKISDLICRIW